MCDAGLGTWGEGHHTTPRPKSHTPSPKKMKTELIVVGRTTEAWLKTGEAEYVDRLKHYTQFAYTTVDDLSKVKIEAADYLVLLDEKGAERTSVEAAAWIQKLQNRAPRRLLFVVGGAYGFSDAWYARADEQWSLSRLTFSHQMVRVIFLEQLYRAHTILKGEKYHHV